MTQRNRNDPEHASRVRLYRRRRGERKILGVCGGLADYFGVSSTLVRGLALLSLIFFTVPTLVLYFLAGWLLDTEPDSLFHSEAEEEFWKDVRTKPAQTLSGLRHKFRVLEHRLRAMEAVVTSPAFKMDRELGR